MPQILDKMFRCFTKPHGSEGSEAIEITRLSKATRKTTPTNATAPVVVESNATPAAHNEQYLPSTITPVPADEEAPASSPLNPEPESEQPESETNGQPVPPQQEQQQDPLRADDAIPKPDSSGADAISPAPVLKPGYINIKNAIEDRKKLFEKLRNPQMAPAAVGASAAAVHQPRAADARVRATAGDERVDRSNMI